MPVSAWAARACARANSTRRSPCSRAGSRRASSVPLLRPPIAADLGLAYARCGRIAEGLSHLDAAVESATTMGRFSRLPLLLVKCGEIHLLAGEPDEADAARVRRRCGSRPSRRSAATRSTRRTCSPRLRAQRGATAEAERHYLDALALATELGMRPLSAHCHAGLARLYARDRQPEKAAEHWTNALFMYREMAMWFWVERLETVRRAEGDGSARSRAPGRGLCIAVSPRIR